MRQTTIPLQTQPTIHISPVNSNPVNYSPPHYHHHHYSPPHYSPIRISPPHYRQQSLSPDKIYNLQQGQKKYEQLVQQNLWLNQQIAKKRFGQPSDLNVMHSHHYQKPADRIKTDIILSTMMQRTRFLQQKIQKLKKQQHYLSNSIRSIQSTDQWQTRHICIPSRCYHQKYMQLLRVRSPFF